jgi:hypothetical protein
MKTANVQNSMSLQVLAVQEGLDRDPTDEERILDSFPDDSSRLLASLLLTAYMDSKKDNAKIQKKQDEIYELLLNSTRSTRVTAVSLSQFFFLHPDLLEEFSYIEGSIFFKGKKLNPDSEGLLSLSLKLETFFGSRDIPFKDLLIGIKRYFFKLSEQEDSFYEYIRQACDEYIAGSKTKRRTRIPLKHLRTIFDISIEDIRAAMMHIGYVEIKDKSATVFFTREV